MSQPSFEVGVVYKKNSRYYLAVTDRTLISLRRGELAEVRPYVKYDVVRGLTVERLCARWKIAAADLDAATRPYLAPSVEGIKPRPQGRGRRALDDSGVRVHRMLRLAS